ncbi:MAG: hypothetical protein G01um101418_889 [Parcubacteria group bacterium Gr01-1014_18]|nr:MAG: hypothetical protein Greene041636_928 [Parcubacteria group bacterium Greene0416_36]TSC79785.1 MAG: hypothetical protein G01um101418_889 [Parcubacteria group bacterium Gr01-1014_18]TSC98069.1 MAG: hypothetical protein Greene101420_898 [Parcubacteria group bacterium Greene1014_20]TSD06504.1 MAG: hypothetical protein Greene07142_847 [Parcubacteria group bacterium Greene0714_2]
MKNGATNPSPSLPLTREGVATSPLSKGDRGGFVACGIFEAVAPFLVKGRVGDGFVVYFNFPSKIVAVFPGFALPLDSFMTWPTRNWRRGFLPAL